jgi:hypothetical protein
MINGELCCGLGILLSDSFFGNRNESACIIAFDNLFNALATIIDLSSHSTSITSQSVETAVALLRTSISSFDLDIYFNATRIESLRSSSSAAFHLAKHLGGTNFLNSSKNASWRGSSPGTVANNSRRYRR